MSTTTIDHDEIRKWAEGKGGKPASVDSTHKGKDAGIIRLMFPKSKQSEHDHLVEISWDEFFEQFDDSKLALIYEEDSMFSKLVSRDSADIKPAAKKSTAKHAEPKQDEKDTKAKAKAEPKDAAKDEKPEPKTSKEDLDLKAREYTDADGKVHHHTSAYMERHKDDK